MLLILDGPVRAGSWLHNDVKPQTLSILVLFHPFLVLSSRLATLAAQSFFISVGLAGFTDPFHPGCSLFRSLFGNIVFDVSQSPPRLQIGT